MTEDLKFFTQIPSWVDEIEDINDFQARLLGYIYTFENTVGSAFPNNQTIADHFHKSKTRVQHSLSDLYEKKYVTSKVIRNEKQEIVKRFLYVHKPTVKNDTTYGQKRLEVGSKMTLPMVKNDQGIKSISKSIIKSNNKDIVQSQAIAPQTLKTDPNEQKAEHAFEILWYHYPVKKGKKEAHKHFMALYKQKKLPNVRFIAEKLKQYVDEVNNQNATAKDGFHRRFKDGSTWFNQESWNDELSPEVQRSQNLDSDLQELRRLEREQGLD